MRQQKLFVQRWCIVIFFTVFILPACLTTNESSTENSDAVAYHHLGVDYAQLGKYKEAIEAFKKAIRLDPDFADAHYALGLTYLMLNDAGSSFEQYEILKRLDPEKANKLLNVIYPYALCQDIVDTF